MKKNSITFRCKACAHPDRTQIEMLCAAGQSFALVGRRFGLTKDVCNRHYTHHVSADRKAVMIAGTGKLEELRQRAQDESASLLDNLRYVRAGLFKMYDAAVELGDGYTASVLSGRLMDSFTSIGKLTGEIARLGGSVTINNNFFSDPRFIQLQSALVRALARHPEARADVLSVFRELDRPALPAPAPPIIDAECEVVR